MGNPFNVPLPEETQQAQPQQAPPASSTGNPFDTPLPEEVKAQASADQQYHADLSDTGPEGASYQATNLTNSSSPSAAAINKSTGPDIMGALKTYTDTHNSKN